jgi:hypothetical protein
MILGKNSSVVTIEARLSRFMRYMGKSNKSISEEINVAESTLSKALKMNTLSSSKVVVLILNKYPQLSAEWLIRGTGEMLLHHSNIQEPKEIYLTGQDLYNVHNLIKKVKELDVIVKSIEIKINK